MNNVDRARQELDAINGEIYAVGYDRNAALHTWSENQNPESLAVFKRLDDDLPGKLDDANKRKSEAIQKLNTALDEFQRSCFQEKK